MNSLAFDTKRGGCLFPRRWSSNVSLPAKAVAGWRPTDNFFERRVVRQENFRVYSRPPPQKRQLIVICLSFLILTTIDFVNFLYVF